MNFTNNTRVRVKYDKVIAEAKDFLKKFDGLTGSVICENNGMVSVSFPTGMEEIKKNHLEEIV
jgi:hypothetical protein